MAISSKIPVDERVSIVAMTHSYTGVFGRFCELITSSSLDTLLASLEFLEVSFSFSSKMALQY